MAKGLKRLSVGSKFAQRNTLNDMAFKTMNIARERVGDEFIIRNRWTQRSIRVERAKKTGDDAIVGSTEQYMADQELGAKTGKGSGLHVPTPFASGESPRANVRRKVVRRANRMDRLNPQQNRFRSGAKEKERNMVAVRRAVKAKQKTVVQVRNNKKGIYRIKGRGKNLRTNKVQDISRKMRTVPKHPWLEPSSNEATQFTGEFYLKHFNMQADRAFKQATGRNVYDEAISL